jgi:two-component system, OmpR family, response regulator
MRITYVEDEPDIRAITEIALRTIGGFTLDVCVCGRDALERSTGFRPDLVLLDVMMPEMDGIETYRRLRKLNGLASTPIVFMTASVLHNEVANYKALGAAAVIAKPFNPLGLADQLRAIVKTEAGRAAHAS